MAVLRTWEARGCRPSCILCITASWRRGLTILQGDDARDLLHRLGKEILLGPHGENALLARRQLWRWLFQAAGQHHMRARALEQGENLQPQARSLLHQHVTHISKDPCSAQHAETVQYPLQACKQDAWLHGQLRWLDHAGR